MPKSKGYSFSMFKFTTERLGTSGNIYDLPLARSGHRVIIDKYNLYSFGGYNPNIGEDYIDPQWPANRPQFSEVWTYNLISRLWRRIPTSCKHPGLASFCLTQYGRLAILFGGTVKEFEESANNKLTVYNLDSNVWSENIAVTGPRPPKSYGQGIISEGNKVYIIGGTCGIEYFMDVHVFDIIDRSWTFLQSENQHEVTQRYRHEIVKVGNLIYVIGGGTSFLAFNLDNILTFNLNTHIWTKTPTFVDPVTKSYPMRRKCHIALKYKNYIYVHGGQVVPPTVMRYVSKTCDQLWRLNLDTFVWQKLPTISSQGLFFHSGAITEEGCFYVFGGNTNAGRTNQVERVWLDIPSLKTMSMEALSLYFPHLHRRRAIDLLKAGVPRSFVKELRPDEFS